MQFAILSTEHGSISPCFVKATWQSFGDTGPGIPEADLDLIFEPFHRGSRPASDGVGLGLSIVRRIVGIHNGSIGVENIVLPDRTGLRVTVRFPLAL